MEAAVETKRAYIGKMKTLQSNTRKNEEYQMCIQEVEKTEAAIDSLETSELELMERLETAKTDMEQKIRRARTPSVNWRKRSRALTGRQRRTRSS